MSVKIDYTNGLELTPLVDKLGTVSSSGAVDLSTGNVFNFTPTADTTFTFNNAPSNAAFSFSLNIFGSLATTPYDLANASYVTSSANLTQESSPRGLFIKPDDGTKLYISGWSDNVFQYSLSTGWDASSVSYDSKSHNCAAQTGAPADVEFHPNGSMMFVLGASTNVFHYDLTTPWDVSTASFTRQSGAVPGGTYGFRFKQDGTSYYTISYSDSTYGSITQWNLSTAWDISTATEYGEFVLTSINEQSTGIYDVDFSSDGTKAFVISLISDAVYEYGLSTPWDITSAAASHTRSFSVANETPTPRALIFADNGTKLYVLGNASGNNKVLQYSTASSVQTTLSFPTNIDWINGIVPDMPELSSIDTFMFITSDGGLTYQGKKTGTNLS